MDKMTEQHYAEWCALRGVDQVPLKEPEQECPRGGEPLPCMCYQGPDFSQMTREELEAAAERWRQRAIEAESGRQA